MNHDRVRLLLTNLQASGFGVTDQHGDMTGMLGLCAVAAGRKPAALLGDTEYSTERLGHLESVLQEADVTLRWDPGLYEYAQISATPSAPFSPAELSFFRWLEDRVEASQDLWAFTDPAIAPKIDTYLRGETTCAGVLGYPACCADWHTLMYAQRWRRPLDDLIQRHGILSCAELVDATDNGNTFNPDQRAAREVIHPQYTKSIAAFPFIEFVACPTCTRRSDSAAARCNGSLRALASALDPSFEDRLRAHGNPDPVVRSHSATPPAGAERAQRRLPRNELCLCGSGLKYKRCCMD